MNTRRLSYGLMFTLATALVAACGGDNPPPETPPPPPPAAPEPPASPAADTAAAGTPAPGGDSAKTDAAPAPKAGKDKIQGKWGFDFSGDVRQKAEDDAHKKAGKDDKKFADLMKKEEDKRAKNHIELTGDTLIIYDGDKPVNKVHYDVGNDAGGSLTLKLGKDEVSKKDYKGKEFTITFKDDNSISVPDLKDDKKPAVSYKRQ